MNNAPEKSWFGRFLAWLARAVYRHPRFFFYPQVLLFGASIFYTVSYLQFSVNRNDLVGSDKRYHQNFLKLREEFPLQDDLVVVVESEDTEKNRQFVERLGVRLEAETDLFRGVFYKGDLRMLGAKALLFLSEEDLTELQNTLREFRPFIDQFTRATNLVSLVSLVNSQFRTAKREASPENESLVDALPALERIFTQAMHSLRLRGTPPSPGINALFNAGEEAEQQMYITFANGRIYLVTAHAPTEELNVAAVERLRELVAETQREVTGLNVGLTGEPVLELDEMDQSKRDSAVASIVALFLCAIVFIYGYQETGRPIKATICLLVGLAYTLGFATFVIGHLNILTITFVPILIGLAIDFGVHLITRYEEELRHGQDEEGALTRAMVFTGKGIFTGAFTTAGAFLAMGLTDFKGIQEMGIICGGGLLICLVPMMTLLPVLLLRGRQNVLDHSHVNVQRRARIENLWLRRPVLVTIATVILCGLAIGQFRKVYFDYNLLNMQSGGLSSVIYEKKLINSTPKSVLFAAVVADSLEDAAELEERIRQLPAVADIESISRFLLEDQTRKLEIIREIKADLANVEFRPPDPEPVDLPEFSRTLFSLSGYLGAALKEVEREEPALAGQLDALRHAIARLRKEMLRSTPYGHEDNRTKLSKFQRALFNDVRDTFTSLRTQDASAPLAVDDLPLALRDRFVGVTGKFLLQVYPRDDVWQRENQREFIGQLRELVPDVTGTPVQLYEYTTLLRESYEEAAWYALGAIAVLVLIHFRNLGSLLLALVPVGIGAVWTGGLMGVFGIPFNPANIMTLPLVIGIGVTNGIHILNRFAEERSPSILAKSTGKAVLVSGLTTIAGFGSLMLAEHRGIQSLGYVMSIGVAMCMIAGLTFLPALLNLISRSRRDIKQPSADNARSTLGREEPR